jgi:2-methylisocitrate lyase-like PEP mutase family enzyme
MISTQHNRATQFRGLHIPGRPLLLANAWDAATARIAEDAGVAAVATTSAGVAWSAGAGDGDRLDRDHALDVVRQIVTTVHVPVTADIENGYAADTHALTQTIQKVLAAGAVGVNIEDALYGTDGPLLRHATEQADRIRAMRDAANQAGIPMFINARIDTYLREVDSPSNRLADTLSRAETYLAAGADGIFVPGVVDTAVISKLVAETDGPLNVMVGPGSPTVDELAALGVARISLGASIAAAAYGLAQRAARELLRTGTYSELHTPIDYSEINSLFASR